MDSSALSVGEPTQTQTSVVVQFTQEKRNDDGDVEKAG
jgi:hypothetical protein